MKDFFVQTLLSWFTTHQRDLPWRKTTNPYFIWLSEVILQQTRVAQGLPYYQKFVAHFPTIQELAQAPQEQVLRLWQGLGYYSRARNMQESAKKIAFEYQGNFPKTFAELKTLKGIGDYTAAAIASFAFGEAVAVLDGNVFRVISRFFGIEKDISSHEGKKYFQAFVQEILPAQQSSTYNQAIMEFGALQCVPKNPNCANCGLRGACVAFAQQKQALLPLKAKKIQVKERHLDYLIFVHQNKILMKARQGKDIWEGLYDFLAIENQSCPSELQEIYDFCVQQELFFGQKAHPNFLLKALSDRVKHQLTHQKIWIRFFVLEIISEKFFEQLKNDYLLELFEAHQIEDLPKPIVVANFLGKNFHKIFD